MLVITILTTTHKYRLEIFYNDSCKSGPDRDLTVHVQLRIMVKTPAAKVASAGSAKAAAATPKHVNKDGAKGKAKRTKHKPNFKERRKLKALKQAGGSKPAVPASAATPGKGKKPADSKPAKDVAEPAPSETKAAASPESASASAAQKKATPKKPQTPASSRRPKA